MAWGDKILEDTRSKAGKLLTVSPGTKSKSCLGVFPRAANAIEWVANRSFLNVPQIVTKYTRQFQIIRDLFQLYCPVCNSTRPESIDCWGKTQMELESQILLRWDESLQDEKCPKCGNTKLGFYEDQMLEPMDTLAVCCGMRSGKSVLAALIASYMEHELAFIGSPGSYFDILAGDPLQISFIATTGKQSVDTVFSKFRALRENAPWIRTYIAFVKEQERKQVISPGLPPWEYSENSTEISNGMLNIEWRALNSNSSGLAGATRLAVFVDELSRFDLSESARSADEILKVMTQGTKTVRSACTRLKLRSFWGLLCATSSPISREDKTMQMVKQKIPGQLSYHYPTWEFNPDLPRSAFDADFQRDPVGAARDFGASPPNAASPFVDDEGRFRQAINFDAKPLVRFTMSEPVDKTGRKYIGAQVAEAKREFHYTHYLHFDAGASFDTFGGASAHGEWVIVKDPTGVNQRKYVTVYDWVLGIRPVIGKTLEEKRTVWFDSIVVALAAISKHMKIGLVTFDRWNSEKLIQDIRDLGINTENRSIKTPDFMAFLRATYEGDVRLLPPRLDEPDDPKLKNDAERAIYELLRLERSEDLTKIYNPKKGRVQGMNSDDMAQVVVGAHLGVQRSIVAISDSVAVKEVKRREEAGSAAYYTGDGEGQAGGRIARGRNW